MEHDLAIFIELNKIIQTLLNSTQGAIDLIKLGEIGDLLGKIKWCETSPDCIRNKHGYRNRYKEKGNCLNTGNESAKINFETLAHLKDLASDQAYQWLLTKNPSYVKNGLRQLQEQVNQVLKSEHKHLTVAQQNELNGIVGQSAGHNANTQDNFLVIICSYYHDLRCLDRIHDLLTMLQSEAFKGFNLKNDIDRYQLGYVFLQLGETAKEISDFIKPEIDKRCAEKNLTRFLFCKLAHYRQTIKDTPFVISGSNIQQVTLMYLLLQKASPFLLKFIESVRTYLSDLASTNDPLDAIVGYTNCNIRQQNGLYSNLENAHLKDIEQIIEWLKTGTTELSKKLKGINSEIDEKEKAIKNYEEKILLLQKQSNLSAPQPTQTNPDSKAESNSSTQQPIKIDLDNKLYQTIFSEKKAEMIMPLIEKCQDEFLTTNSFSPEEIQLIKSVRRKKEDGKSLDEKQKKALCYLIKDYKKSVDTAIERYCNKYAGDSSVLPKPQSYQDWIQFLSSKCGTKQDSTKEIDKINEKKQKLEELITELKKKAQSVQADAEAEAYSVTEYTSKLSDVKNSSVFRMPSCYNNMSSKERILIDIVKESSFMQFLYHEIEMALIAGDEPRHRKLVMASKLSFAFYGQYYKTIDKSKLEPNLIESSILSKDCYDVMLLRHRQIAHNTFACNGSEFQNALEKKVVPWLKDFKYMVRLFLDDAHTPHEVSNLVPDDIRLFEEFTHYSESDKVLFFHYTRLVALNRFLRSEDALAAYNKINLLIHPDTNPDLATEIHWQASLAYRNLSDFGSCVQMLLLALESSKKISDERIRGYKISGVHCDLGIAYIHLDEFDKAKLYLKQVTTTPIGAGNNQIIGANVLLGQIELALGFEIIGRAHLELTFVKYWQEILEFSKPMAIGFLNQLASFYLDDFDLNAAHDCLELAETVLRDHLAEFISASGQAVGYFKAMLLNNLARHRMLVALIQAQPEQTQRQIENVYHELCEAQTHQDALRYYDKKPHGLLIFSQAAILLNCKHDKVLPFIEEQVKIQTQSELDVDQIVQEIKQEIYAFNEKLLDQSDLEPNHSAHELKLKRLTEKLIYIFRIRAFSDFLSGKINDAQAQIKKAILSEVIVDFFEFEFEQIMKKNSLQQWLQSYTYSERAISDYLRKRLYEPNFQHESITINESMIRRYSKSRHDPVALNELINENEIHLMAALYQERGEAVMQFKNNQSSNDYIHRFFSLDSSGRSVIRERHYRYLPTPTNTATTMPPSHPVSSQTRDETTSAEFDSLFKGIFTSAGKKRAPSSSTCNRRSDANSTKKLSPI